MLDTHRKLSGIWDGIGHSQFDRRVITESLPGAEGLGFRAPTRRKPNRIWHKRRTAPDRRLPARMASVEGRQRDALRVTCQQLLRFKGQDDLGAPAAGPELAVQSFPVAPEEDHLVQQSIPLGRSHPDQTLSQGGRRHRQLVANAHLIGQRGEPQALRGRESLLDGRCQAS